jgi:hypothetical protein
MERRSERSVGYSSPRTRRGARGDLTIVAPLAGVLRLEYRGFITSELAGAVHEAVDASVAQAATLELFIDGGYAAGFDAGFRDAISVQVRRFGANVTMQHCYFESPAGRAALFVLGLLTRLPPYRLYTRRAAFEAAYAEALARRHPRG